MVRTQVRVAPMGGIIGLDYSVVFQLLDRLGIPHDEQYIYFRGIQIFEREWLNKIREEENKPSNKLKGQKNSSMESKTIGNEGR